MRFLYSFLLAAVCFGFMSPLTAVAADSSIPSKQLLVNGGFQNGLTGWKQSGDVTLETGTPVAGGASVRIGPGAGSISQRIPVGPQNHLTLSATLHGEPADAGKLIIRFLDSKGNELMRISNADMERKGDKLTDYFKLYPLTASVEVIVAKDAAPGYLTAGQMVLTLWEDDLPTPADNRNVGDLLRPFWQGSTVSGEAVLMQSSAGKPALGTLMFHPTRVLSVTSYDTGVKYAEGADYIVEGRTLIAPRGSRMTTIADSGLLKGELAWNIVGGKQVLVTYEHSDAWTGPVQPYVGDLLPETMQRLNNRAPLTIVAYGDSITFGIGSSHMRQIAPYQMPWIDLFAEQLRTDYADPGITLNNSSQSGATSEWAKRMAARMVASLNPDLVVIAFGQNDFWSIDAGAFARNILSVIETVRATNPRAEFLLVSTTRFDPAYSARQDYWDRVSDYDSRLRALAGPGVQLVDMTAISAAVFAAKEPKDCLNDPLHPNDYLSRWYAQSMLAALAPGNASHPARSPQ